MKGSLVISSFVLAALSFAVNGPPGTTQVPAGGGSMPNYFAGTLNKVSAYIVVSTPPPGQSAYIVNATLKIGNPVAGIPFETVRQYSYQSGYPLLLAWNPTCTFDSTHFPDLSELHVNLDATDSLGRYYHAVGISTVKNKAAIGNHTFNGISGSQSWDDVIDALAYSHTAYNLGHYTTETVVNGNLTLSNWRAALGRANFVYISTHGTATNYQMENSNLYYEGGPSSSYDSHRNQLESTVGTFNNLSLVPPFNPTGIPPINFMFLDACDCFGAKNCWTDILYPNFNLYNGIQSSANQFAAGFTTKFYDNQSEDIAQSIMSYLKCGTPAYASIANAVADLSSDGITNTSGQLISLSMVDYLGDPHTKVVGVYTGNSLASTAWYL